MGWWWILIFLITGIILGVIIWKKLYKKITTPVILIVFLVIWLILQIVAAIVIGRIIPGYDNYKIIEILFGVAGCIHYAVIFSLLIELILSFFYQIIKKKILNTIIIAMTFFIFLFFYIPIKLAHHRMSFEDGKNFVRCKIHFGDWIAVPTSWNYTFECGLERTSDGGMPCISSDECELDCVEEVANGWGQGMCQTHKRFLDNKTYRRKWENVMAEMKEWDEKN